MRHDELKLLGLSGDAGEKEIKGAFRRLARQLHPDVSASSSDHELFKQILLAYESLMQGGSGASKAHAGPPPSRETSAEWARLRSLSEEAVTRLLERSKEAAEADDSTLAAVCEVAANMLSDALAQYQQVLQRYRNNPPANVRLSLLDVAENFGDASLRMWEDPQDTVAANLAKGHLGAVGISRAVLVTGRNANPDAKERAAKAILSELSAALLAVGAIALRGTASGAGVTPALLEAKALAATSVTSDGSQIKA